MPNRVARAVECGRLFRRDRLQGRNGNYVLRIGGVRVDAESLFVYGHRLAAHKRMAVVVLAPAPRPAIDNGLVAIEAGSFLAFHGPDGDRAEFDALDRLPGRHVALQDLYPVEPGLLEGMEEFPLLQRTRNASAPQLWIIL